MTGISDHYDGKSLMLDRAQPLLISKSTSSAPGI